MSRVLIFLAMWLLVLGAARATPLAAATSGASSVFQTGPTYRYTLKEDHDPAVCKHMLHVFNDNFTRLWDAPPLSYSGAMGKPDPIYSADGKYAFPRLPGVKYNAEVTFNWRFFAQPTSPEFRAVHWEQGMAIAGGCPAGRICPGENPQPILIGHFDFDNDGTLDTAVVLGAFSGYMDAVDPINEYLTVWRDQMISVHGLVNLWDLGHPQNVALTPITIYGKYFRPFVYASHTYVAKYVPQYAQYDLDPNSIPEWTWTPSREDMLVQKYSFTGQKQRITGRPEWTIDVVCDFEMKPLN